MAGRTPVLQHNWQSSEKSQYVKEKTQYLMNTLYMGVSGCVTGVGCEGECEWECLVSGKRSVLRRDASNQHLHYTQMLLQMLPMERSALSAIRWWSLQCSTAMATISPPINIMFDSWIRRQVWFTLIVNFANQYEVQREREEEGHTDRQICR